jgi:hypothetical protein
MAERSWQAALELARKQLAEAKTKRSRKEVARLELRVKNLEKAQQRQSEPAGVSRRRYAFLDQ